MIRHYTASHDTSLHAPHDTSLHCIPSFARCSRGAGRRWHRHFVRVRMPTQHQTHGGVAKTKAAHGYRQETETIGASPSVEAQIQTRDRDRRPSTYCSPASRCPPPLSPPPYSLDHSRALSPGRYPCRWSRGQQSCTSPAEQSLPATDKSQEKTNAERLQHLPVRVILMLTRPSLHRTRHSCKGARAWVRRGHAIVDSLCLGAILQRISSTAANTEHVYLARDNACRARALRKETWQRTRICSRGGETMVLVMQGRAREVPMR
jgi:hypothetical protein